MGFFRNLLPVAAAAAVGAALVVMAEKLVAQQEQEHIMDPEAFDEDAAESVNDAPEAADTATDEETEPEPAAEPVTEPAAEKAPESRSIPVEDGPLTPAYQPADHSAPNVNPVRDNAEETPLTPEGKVDVEHIASPADFGNWDDLGCQG